LPFAAVVFQHALLRRGDHWATTFSLGQGLVTRPYAGLVSWIA